MPRYYVTDEPPIGGQIKVRPEDFVVDELPLYDPDGEGEHLLLGIEKCNVAHGELMSCVRRHFGVREVDVGFAGMKDKAAVTRQAISVRCPADPDAVEIPHERIRVLWAARHGRKIRRGHLAGNRFSVRIREVDPLKLPQVKQQLERLQQIGVPAYFGAQRFGYRINNQLIGMHLLHRDWKAALHELLGTGGAPFPAHQQARREAFDRGEFKEALHAWSAADRSELSALRSLCRGESPQRACRMVGRTAHSFWISAVQSAIFNHVVDGRLERGLIERLEEGDLAWVHAKRAVFAVTAEELGDPALPKRLVDLEVSPSGPLWGRGMTEAKATIGQLERDALEASGVARQLQTDRRRDGVGARRPLRAPISNVELESGVDNEGAFIRVAFDLPRGLYATVVLRELMKSDASDAAPERTTAAVGDNDLPRPR